MLNTLEEIRDALDIGGRNAYFRENMDEVRQIQTAKTKLTTLIEQWESEELVERVAKQIDAVVGDHIRQSIKDKAYQPDWKYMYMDAAKAAIRAITGEAGEVVEEVKQEPPPNKRTFMVFVEGRESPTYKHENFKSAYREASRLQGMFPERKVFILKHLITFREKALTGRGHDD